MWAQGSLSYSIQYNTSVDASYVTSESEAREDDDYMGDDEFLYAMENKSVFKSSLKEDNDWADLQLRDKEFHTNWPQLTFDIVQQVTNAANIFQ